MKSKKTANKVHMLWHFMRGSKRFFLIGVLSTIAVTLLELLSPQIMRATIDSVLGDKALPSAAAKLVEAIGGRDYLRAHLWWPALAVLAIAGLAAVFQYLSTVSNTRAAETLVKTMRDDLFGHMQHLPFSWHMKNQTGDMIQRCTSDVDTTNQFVSGQLVNVFHIVLLLVLSLAFMFSMNVRLALVAVVTFPVIILFSAVFQSRIGRLFAVCDENEGVLSTLAQENLTGVRVVRAFGREAYVSSQSPWSKIRHKVYQKGKGISPQSIPEEKLVGNGLMVLEPVAVAGHIDDLTAMDQAVEDGGGDGGVAKEVGPLVKALV